MTKICRNDLQLRYGINHGGKQATTFTCWSVFCQYVVRWIEIIFEEFWKKTYRFCSCFGIVGSLKRLQGCSFRLGDITVTSNMFFIRKERFSSFPVVFLSIHPTPLSHPKICLQKKRVIFVVNSNSPRYPMFKEDNFPFPKVSSLWVSWRELTKLLYSNLLQKNWGL